VSRAFVKESDDAGEPLPELAISPHPNFVTPAGLRQIDARVATLEADLRAARAAEDKPLLARIQRDLRYWTQRRATARIVSPTSYALE
jgi:transcription elongation GreA/GreB family factor